MVPLATDGADTNGNRVGVVQRLQLRRRRSRVPWIYAVYHARHRPEQGGASRNWIGERTRHEVNDSELPDPAEL
jgi:hypothetical protein